MLPPHFVRLEEGLRRRVCENEKESLCENERERECEKEEYSV